MCVCEGGRGGEGVWGGTCVSVCKCMCVSEGGEWEVSGVARV